MGDYDAILLEDINHKFDAILEGQTAMAHVPGQLHEIDTRLKNVESDVKIIKTAATDQSRRLDNHEQRITRLEQSA